MSNNLNVRLNKAKQNVKTEMNSPGTAITNRLSALTNTFKKTFLGQTTNNNKSPIATNSILNKTDNPFNNPIMLWSLIIITLGFIIYGLYYYYTKTSTVQTDKSYYGANLLSYSPLFTLNTEQIDPCIQRCEADPLCDGITFNRDDLTCVGTNRGQLRDDIGLSAWTKPQNVNSVNNKNVILVGLAKENVSILADKISYPGNPYEFNWSMYLFLNDHNASHGVWRHILHKGSDVPDQIDTPNWEDVISQFPDQSIGIWMAPFNNNLRIALTTITSSIEKNSKIHAYKHAYSGEQHPVSGKIYLTDKPNPPFQDTLKHKSYNTRTHQSIEYEKNIEFFDIYQIPVKKINHLSVNVMTNTIEVYIDGNLYKVFTLTGKPEFNRGNLYIMKPKTIDGYIQKLSYSPASLTLKNIKELVNSS